MPNFGEIAPTAADIMAIFLISKDGGRRHVGFSKFQIVNGRKGQEGRSASVCQISSKSLKLRPKYGDFSIFKMAAAAIFVR